MINPYKIISFVLGTVVILWVSRTSLRSTQHHGFYRFWSWQAILILFLLNVEHWLTDPFSVRQLFAWAFLILSLVLVLEGVRLFRQQGNLDEERADPALVGIEKTTKLVTTGLYKYIRHPFYSSLLFLGWGIFLKQITWIGLLLAGFNTLMLVMTARKEEIENIHFFGGQYQKYMEKTKMFIPLLF